MGIEEELEMNDVDFGDEEMPDKLRGADISPIGVKTKCPN